MGKRGETENAEQSARPVNDDDVSKRRMIEGKMREGVRGKGRGTDNNMKRREDARQPHVKNHVKKNSGKGTGSAGMSLAQIQTPAALTLTRVPSVKEESARAR